MGEAFPKVQTGPKVLAGLMSGYPQGDSNPCRLREREVS